MTVKEVLVRAGFAAFGATGLHRLAAPVTRGRGAILMFHHVRPFRPAIPGYAPNGMLEIEPDFLDALLARLRGQGYEIVALDAVQERLAAPGGQPFVALTFDDGYRDNVEYALPVLRAHGAPFTMFVTTGFASHSAGMWWLELEDAIARQDRVELTIAGRVLLLPARTPQEKAQAFKSVYWALRALPEPDMLAAIAGMARHAGVTRIHAAELCLGWDELRVLARDPLCTIGAHTLTHPMLAKHDAGFVRREMEQSKAIIEHELGQPVAHFAYPVGDASAAGPREFALARELGFKTAVTTRPGMLFADHAEHLTALPRVSINGLWQSAGALDILLSGAPFAIWNRGRRVNAA